MFNKSRFCNENGIILSAGQEDLHSDSLSDASDKYGVLVAVTPVKLGHLKDVFDYRIYQAHNEVDPAMTYGDDAVPPDYAKVATTRLIASGSATYFNNYISFDKQINFKINGLVGKEAEKVLEDVQKGWHLINVNVPAVISSDWFKHVSQKPSIGNYKGWNNNIVMR